ncbi:MAG: hypothetical protein NT132_07470 [Microbacterium sp.]|uniref:hypothetical protein n=1 Tax=Microbacterium sp. TaxID=51671 RepID=UPI00262CA8BE|nr:hypothetical protein [Microbacterium sp.]MCX6502227.1 hypothetical protein [Microbacterium sp.]
MLMDLIEPICGKKLRLGAVDVASQPIDTPDEIADTPVARRFVDADRMANTPHQIGGLIGTAAVSSFAP